MSTRQDDSTSGLQPSIIHPGIAQPDIPLPGIAQSGFIQPFQQPWMAPLGLDQPLQQSMNRPQITNGPQALPTRLSQYSNTRDQTKRFVEVPLELSTCLYISHLPADCTPAQVLEAIRGIGKVCSLRIWQPEGLQPFSTAKLSFWGRPDTDRFLALSRAGGFRVGEFVPTVRMNAHRTPPRAQTDASRVVRLVGPAQIVNREHLEGFFSRCGIRYQVDRVDVHEETDQDTHLEFHFASYPKQAQFAARRIRQAQRGRGIPDQVDIKPAIEDEWQLWNRVDIFWGKDPCESI